MNACLQILLVDNEPVNAQILTRFLQDSGLIFDLHHAKTLDDCLTLDLHDIDLIVVHLTATSVAHESFLDQLREIRRKSACIAILKTDSMELERILFSVGIRDFAKCSLVNSQWFLDCIPVALERYRKASAAAPRLDDCLPLTPALTLPRTPPTAMEEFRHVGDTTIAIEPPRISKRPASAARIVDGTPSNSLNGVATLRARPTKFAFSQSCRRVTCEELAEQTQKELNQSHCKCFIAWEIPDTIADGYCDVSLITQRMAKSLFEILEEHRARSCRVNFAFDRELQQINIYADISRPTTRFSMSDLWQRMRGISGDRQSELNFTTESETGNVGVMTATGATNKLLQQIAMADFKSIVDKQSATLMTEQTVALYSITVDSRLNLSLLERTEIDDLIVSTLSRGDLSFRLTPNAWCVIKVSGDPRRDNYALQLLERREAKIDLHLKKKVPALAIFRLARGRLHEDRELKEQIKRLSYSETTSDSAELCEMETLP